VTPEERYLEFASKVSFFEFRQREFRDGGFSASKITELAKEVSRLQSRNDWDISALSDYILENPKSFLIFQGIFQLLRFTDAQVIHFIFDVPKLNSLNTEAVYEYAFYNLKNDPFLQGLFTKRVQASRGEAVAFDSIIKASSTYSKSFVVAFFKMVVSEYIYLVSRDFALLENRIRNKAFSDFSVRLANYLIGRLKLNETLKAVNVAAYLRSKQIPVDTKGLHGNYAKLRLKEMLDGHGIRNIDSLLKTKGVTVLPSKFDKREIKLPQGKSYCTEKYVEDVAKIINGKLKKFDFVLIMNNRPRHLIETNFYTTEGTKIGINEGEYLELHNSIKNKKELEFHWITDGNYWLTDGGKTRFMNLIDKFGEIYNLNAFEEHLGTLA
jgi:hypothetical protein